MSDICYGCRHGWHCGGSLGCACLTCVLRNAQKIAERIAAQVPLGGVK